MFKHFVCLDLRIFVPFCYFFMIAHKCIEDIIINFLIIEGQKPYLLSEFSRWC